MNYLTKGREARGLAELREKWEMDRVSAINHATKKGGGGVREKLRENIEKSMEIAKKMQKKSTVEVK